MEGQNSGNLPTQSSKHNSSPHYVINIVRLISKYAHHYSLLSLGQCLNHLPKRPMQRETGRNTVSNTWIYDDYLTTVQKANR